MSARFVTMTERVDAAKAGLIKAALAVSLSNPSTQADLFAAANHYVFACWQSAAGRATVPNAKRLFSFGRSKNRTPGEAPTADLEWYRDQLTADVANPAKARWKEGNEEMLEMVKAELAAREGQ